MPVVIVTLTKSEWPYTEVQRKDIELHPGEKIGHRDGWIIAQVAIKTQQGREALNQIWPDTRPDRSEAGEQTTAPGFAGPWETWPPERELVVGHEYLVRTLIGQQRHPREMRVSYLGRGGPHGTDYQFNARPAFGTQTLRANMIIATKDLGKSEGRESSKRYCNKVIR